MHPMLNIAVRAARRAGEIISRAAEHVDGLVVTSKSHNDFVSEVDRRAELEIIQIIHKAYPDHAILAEESGAQHNSSDIHQWIIDPLDGTTNFLHGFPQYAVSIALMVKGQLEQAVIYDPNSQDLYTASRGAGAQLNNRRIRVSRRSELPGTLIGTGFPFRQPELLEPYLDTFRAVAPKVADIRRAGSAALDLAYVAAGRLDGFWEFGLEPWDMAAGVLLIQEAGGVVTDFAGDQNFLTSGNIVGGNLKLHSALLNTIRPVLPKELQR
ncbi:MAG: inositol monophosphatase family protein [Thiohalomonadaceae bacterium]